jgi:hypothetical protein
MSAVFPRRIVTPFLLTFSLLLFAVLSGCGPAGKDGKAVVKGTVTIGGSLANSGQVTFTIGNESLSGMIDPQGNYSVVGLTPGEAKVTVTNLSIPTAPITPGMPGAENVVTKPIPIPAKYGNVETSGLTFTVKKGENTYNIELSK